MVKHIFRCDCDIQLCASVYLKEEAVHFCFSPTGGDRRVSAEARRRKERQTESQLSSGGGTSFPYCAVC